MKRLNKFLIHLTGQIKLVCCQSSAQQIIGREGETATLLSRCLFNSELRVAGFAPRHLNRSAASTIEIGKN